MEKKEDKGRGDKRKRRGETKEGESENIRVRGEGERGKGEFSMRYPKPVGRICPEAVIDKVSLSQPHICICSCYWQRVLSALFYVYLFIYKYTARGARSFLRRPANVPWKRMVMVANRISSSSFRSVEHCFAKDTRNKCLPSPRYNTFSRLCHVHVGSY